MDESQKMEVLDQVLMSSSRRATVVLRDDIFGEKARKMIMDMLASDYLTQHSRILDGTNRITFVIADKAAAEHLLRLVVLPGLESISI